MTLAILAAALALVSAGLAIQSVRLLETRSELRRTAHARENFKSAAESACREWQALRDTLQAIRTTRSEAARKGAVTKAANKSADRDKAGAAGAAGSEG